MRLASTAVVLLGLGLETHAAHAVPGILPPVEITVGEAAVQSAHDAYTATQVTVALSWASLSPVVTPVDFGVGWIGSYAPDVPASSPGMPRRSRDAAGPFVMFALRAAAGAHWRAWLGARGELLYGDERGLLGASAHGAIELWHGVGVSASDGGLIGALGLSVFVDASVREDPAGGYARVLAAGFGGRLPLIAVH